MTDHLNGCALVRRAGLFVLAGLLFSISAGVIYVGYIASSSRDVGFADAQHPTALPMFVLAGAVAWSAMFLLKRAVLPIRTAQDPPEVIAWD